VKLKARTVWSGEQAAFLMSDRRQKIQLELAFAAVV